MRNASKEPGLAAAVQNILTGKGFLPGAIGDAARQRTSTLFFRPGEETDAQRVGTELGGQFKLTADSTLRSGLFRAVLGDDYPVALGRALGGQPTTPTPQGSPTKPSQPTGSSSSAPAAPAINADGVTCVN